ncbi:MAG TPA: hypothetical protein VHS31_15750 [Tepidisphaeraceae bacterium]|jgi:photosystem II stability/assembly factor-like uncharacterized protein|nr:hypothetical protein [Tepidisphaeraceae bacterium]
MHHRPTILESLEFRRFLAAQAYDWNPVTIKGNGYLDGIVYSQAAPNVAYAHADVGGAYRLDPTTNTWIPLTDTFQLNDPAQNGGAQTIAVDPTDPNRVYMVAGTYESNAVILRSTDQGRTWLRTDVSTLKVDGNGWGRDVGERLMVDPNSPNVIYYGAQDYSTSASGLWKSTDFGATWNRVTSFTATGDLWNGTYANANGVGVGFVLFDKTSGTRISASQTIYAGVSTIANTSSKLYVSKDGGTTWGPIANQPATTLTPNRAILSPDGTTMYVAYSDQSGPYAATTGALYKVTNPNSASATWTLVTPSPGAYAAIAFDPTNPSTVYTAVFDRYPDNIYRSTNGGATWTPLTPASHLDNSSAFYANSQSTHWLTDLVIDPANNNVAMFNTGYGIFRTANLTAATPTWSFYNNGLEESAALELASPNTGSVHLVSAIGDRDGFRHDDFTQSPATGTLGQLNGIQEGTDDDIDTAFNDANYMVRVVRVSPYVQFSVDNGSHWAWMPTSGSSGSTSGGGNIAISADGLYTVYEPGGNGRVRYSIRTNSTWSNWVSTGITNQPANGAIITADLVGAHTFYAYAGTTVSRSTDGGATWTVMTTGAPSVGNWIRAVPGEAGNLVMSRNGNGLYRSQDGGATWTRINSAAVTTANQVGVGAPAVVGGYPSIFVGGTVNGINGFFRSDDQGVTWTQINDLSHEYGFVTVIQGDPRVYGRLYVGTNGRGILYADIHAPTTSLPAGWNTLDIGSPGSAGSAGQLAASTTWDVVGGGAGVTGTSDQFRFAYTTLTGNGSITTLVTDVPLGSAVTSNSGYNAKAGVMIRDGTGANAANVFLALTPGSVAGAIFQSRAASGATTTTNASATTGIWPPYWLRLTRAGNQFTAFISPDGTTWTQIGTQSITMSSTINIGLAVTASNNTQLDISHFQNVTITTPPNVIASSYLYNTALNQLSFTFDQDVSASLLASSLTVSPGNFTATSVSWNAATNTATFTLPLASLINGDFTATLNGLTTKSIANDLMTTSPSLPFFVLQGDTNRDGVVNLLDLNAIATNFGSPGPHTLADGDVDYNNQIGISDFNTLAANFGSSVPTQAALPSAVAQSSPLPNLFSSNTINRLDDILE